MGIAVTDVRIVNLKEVMPHLSEKDVGFGKSLVAQFESKGHLSDKQWYWVTRLTDGANIVLAIKEGAIERSDLVPTFPIEKVFTWFGAASKNLKKPAIVFGMQDGSELKIRVTTSGKYPQSLALSEANKYPSGRFYGWVLPNGDWIKGRNADTLLEELSDLLTSLSEDPIACVTNYGCKTGKCCFCNKKLTAGISTSVGYGPECAKKWSLPWNTKVAAHKEQAAFAL